MIRHDSDPAYVKACLVEYMCKYIQDENSNYFLTGIQEGQLDICRVDGLEYDPHVKRFPDPTATHLTFFIAVSHYSESETTWFAKELEQGYRLMHECDMSDPKEAPVRVFFKAVPSIIPATESGLNNAHFKTEQTISHDELRFRSRSEIAIYDELRKRNVLFFPNAAAVLGREFPEEREKREPDFLICHRGKWGILEVSGEPWHSGSISTAKDHDRSRLFQHYGLKCVQHFDSNRCKHSPADVVDEFLMLLSKS